MSDVVVTGAPQGSVLSPFLFTQYTSDFQYDTDSQHLHRFSDDSAVVGFIRDGQESEDRELTDNFVEGCSRNHLLLNVNKSEELVVDFRRIRIVTRLITIIGKEVGNVDNYKYLGIHLSDRLDWTDAVYKKGRTTFYFLTKL